MLLDIVADEVGGDFAEKPAYPSHIIGHEKAYNILQTSLEHNKITGSWLVSGPKGIGKSGLVLEFARSILPKLGSCENPDLLLITPTYLDEKGKETASFIIRIYQIRQMAQKLSQTSVTGKGRVVVIDAVDEMNISAANALLKILEEPPADTTIILISHCVGRILPTIRSRCRVVNLSPLSQDAVLQVLQKNIDTGADADIVDYNDLQFASYISCGSVGSAIDIFNNDGLKLYNDLISILDGFPKIDYIKMREVVTSLSTKDNKNKYSIFINMIEWFLYSVVDFKVNERDLTDFSGRDNHVRNNILQHHSVQNLTYIWTKIQKINVQGVGLNMDKSATIENIFYSLAR